jgi:hypothetical protein
MVTRWRWDFLLSPPGVLHHDSGCDCTECFAGFHSWILSPCSLRHVDRFYVPAEVEVMERLVTGLLLECTDQTVIAARPGAATHNVPPAKTRRVPPTTWQVLGILFSTPPDVSGPTTSQVVERLARALGARAPVRNTVEKALALLTGKLGFAVNEAPGYRITQAGQRALETYRCTAEGHSILSPLLIRPVSSNPGLDAYRMN